MHTDLSKRHEVSPRPSLQLRNDISGEVQQTRKVPTVIKMPTIRVIILCVKSMKTATPVLA